MARWRALALGIALLSAPAAAAGEPEPLPGLRAEAAALLMHGVEGGSLPLAAALFPSVGGSAARGAGFLLEVAAVDGAAGAELEAYVYAVDAAGEVAAHRAVRLPAADPGAPGVKLSGRLELAAGRYSIRFLVLDPATRRYGLAVRELDPAAEAPAVGLAEPCDGWTVAGAAEAGLAELSARPVLVRGERRRLLIAAATANPSGWALRLEPRAAGSGLELAATPVPEGLEFEVPDLPPGVYRLLVAGERRPPPLEVWLVHSLPPDEGGCRRGWGELVRWARAAPTSAAAAPEGRGDRAQRRLAVGYREVLAGLASDGAAAAGERLAALEAPLAERGGELRALFAAELTVARQLAARDPRCLTALLAMHGESYALHYAAGRFPLAAHSRRLAAALGELAAELLTAPAERAVIAGALAGLADRIESRRSSLEAQRLLERALELDPELETARLLLAVSYERKGRYRAARQEYEALVAGNSAHHEARLRLAILELRLGELASARARLEALVAEQPPDWLLSLAYQSLAQLYARLEQYAEAALALETARRRLPADPAIRLLLAYALDRQGERRAAAELLAELPPATAGRTPRYRYSDEPVAARGLLHETLRQSVNVRLPLLARALAAGDGRGTGP